MVGSQGVTVWEPTIDHVARFGPPLAGHGGAFRIGGGASFLNSSRVGVLQLLASPEFHF